MTPVRMLFAAALLTSPAAFAAEIPAKDVAVLAGPCSGCHGADGQGAGAIPAIKGRPASLLLDQLKGFRDGTLSATVMGRLAKGYSDDQLNALAGHFGTK